MSSFIDLTSNEVNNKDEIIEINSPLTPSSSLSSSLPNSINLSDNNLVESKNEKNDENIIEIIDQDVEKNQEILKKIKLNNDNSNNNIEENIKEIKETDSKKLNINKLISKINKETNINIINYINILYPNSLLVDKRYYKNIDNSNKYISIFNNNIFYISQQGTFGSSWSCGYRNIQMMSTVLYQNEEMREKLFDKENFVIPTVKEIQGYIEQAWNNGYDIEV